MQTSLRQSGCCAIFDSRHDHYRLQSSLSRQMAIHVAHAGKRTARQTGTYIYIYIYVYVYVYTLNVHRCLRAWVSEGRVRKGTKRLVQSPPWLRCLLLLSAQATSSGSACFGKDRLPQTPKLVGRAVLSPRYTHLDQTCAATT